MKVLIVKTSSMGDVIHTFPALEDARRDRPDMSFDWCVEEAFAGIVALHPAIGNHPHGRHPALAQALVQRRHMARGGRPAPRPCATCRYDLVIDAQGLAEVGPGGQTGGRARLPASTGRAHASPRRHCSTTSPTPCRATCTPSNATRRLFGLALGYQPDLSTLASGIVPPPGGLAGIDGKTAFLLHGTSREDKKWPVEDWIGTARLLARAANDAGHHLVERAREGRGRGDRQAPCRQRSWCQNRRWPTSPPSSAARRW